jgi:hypothetical protein
MTIYTAILWIYAATASLVFGASVFETLVVHPAWSRTPPESFVAFANARLNLPVFWIPVAQVYALSSIVAAVVSLQVGAPSGALVLSSACAVAAVGWTLVYFRPRIARWIEQGSRNTSGEDLRADVRRWILLNWFRTALVAGAWLGLVSTLTTRVP